LSSFNLFKNVIQRRQNLKVLALELKLTFERGRATATLYNGFEEIKEVGGVQGVGVRVVYPHGQCRVSKVFAERAGR